MKSRPKRPSTPALVGAYGPRPQLAERDAPRGVHALHRHLGANSMPLPVVTCTRAGADAGVVASGHQRPAADECVSWRPVSSASRAPRYRVGRTARRDDHQPPLRLKRIAHNAIAVPSGISPVKTTAKPPRPQLDGLAVESRRGHCCAMRRCRPALQVLSRSLGPRPVPTRPETAARSRPSSSRCPMAAAPWRNRRCFATHGTSRRVVCRGCSLQPFLHAPPNPGPHPRHCPPSRRRGAP